MKNKKKYVAPTLDVEVVQIEQGIAQTSAAGPASTPTSIGWDELSGGTQTGEGN